MISFEQLCFKSMELTMPNGQKEICSKHRLISDKQFKTTYSFRSPCLNEIIDIDHVSQKLDYCVYCCERLTDELEACWECIHKSTVDCNGHVVSSGEHALEYWLSGDGATKVRNSAKVMSTPHTISSSQVLRALYPYKIITPEESSLPLHTLILEMKSGHITRKYKDLIKDFEQYHWGLELELTHISQEELVRLVRVVTGSSSSIYKDDHLSTFWWIDGKGRKWKVVQDSSIHSLDANGMPTTDSSYKCELVFPVCQGLRDIELLYTIVNVLNSHNAVVNESCSVHVHVSPNFEPSATCLRNLIFLIYSYQGSLYRLANTHTDRKVRYCKPLPDVLVTQLLNTSNSGPSIDAIRDAWYKSFPSNRNATAHYHDSRYSIVNLHSFFEHQGVEFRLFNGSMDAIEIIDDVFLSVALMNASDRIQYISCLPKSSSHYTECMTELLDGIGLAFLASVHSKHQNALAHPQHSYLSA